MRHILALLAIAVAAITGGAVLIALSWHLPYWHALYCSLGTAATDGCDAAPHDGSGYLVAAAVILIAIPALAGVFSVATSLHIRRHQAPELARIRDVAEKAHRIAAATHKAVTGRDHPDAPPPHTTEDP